MEITKTDLLGEINQLLSQYRAEVPGGRRAWPESIKNRVMELRNHGLNYTEIARQAGIPYFTVLKWQRERKKPGFDLVNVVPRRRGRPRKVATVTVPTPAIKAVAIETATVTVTTPKGIRIEGISEALLLELIERLEGRQ